MKAACSDLLVTSTGARCYRNYLATDEAWKRNWIHNQAFFLVKCLNPEILRKSEICMNIGLAHNLSSKIREGVVNMEVFSF